MIIREADNIPEELVLNLDETGIHFTYRLMHYGRKRKEKH